MISTGTERTLVNFGKANYLNKALQQPDKVKDVIRKLKTDGVAATYEAVKTKLDEPMPLGYCNVGTVVESRFPGFNVGDRVVSNGSHAEFVTVPGNLCALIPPSVDSETAVFTVLSSIGMQGVRLASVSVGETVVVMGLGVIGLLTVQILLSSGCRVFCTDFDAGRVELAKSFGADVIQLGAGVDPAEELREFSRGLGADAVIITASTTSSEPIKLATAMLRKRGKLVLVGVTGLELSRSDFYEKEITFQVSCSYGPGRYDKSYEELGQDYPVGFVRWTEQRNFQSVLDLMALKKISTSQLVSRKIPIREASKAYGHLEDDSILGIMLKYDDLPESGDSILNTIKIEDQSRSVSQDALQPQPQKSVNVGFLGGGAFASRILIPAFKATNAHLNAIVTRGGVRGTTNAKRHGFDASSTSIETLLSDPQINTLVIATRHDLHASQAILGLEAGKHVYVEKPAAITQSELEALAKAKATSAKDKILMVGFNRRFAPMVHKMKRILQTVQAPKSMVITVAAGSIESEHWTQDPLIGGGRIVGEVCHFIDLLRHLAGSKIKGSSIVGLKESDIKTGHINDTVTISLTFADGSLGTIHYFANSGRNFPKERIEVFCGGRVLQLNNYRSLRAYGWPNVGTTRGWRQDKGHNICVSEFVNAILNGEQSPIPWEEVYEVSKVALDLSKQVSKNG